MVQASRWALTLEQITAVVQINPNYSSRSTTSTGRTQYWTWVCTCTPQQSLHEESNLGGEIMVRSEYKYRTLGVWVINFAQQSEKGGNGGRANLCRILVAGEAPAARWRTGGQRSSPCRRPVGNDSAETEREGRRKWEKGASLSEEYIYLPEYGGSRTAQCGLRSKWKRSCLPPSILGRICVFSPEMHIVYR